MSRSYRLLPALGLALLSACAELIPDAPEAPAPAAPARAAPPPAPSETSVLLSEYYARVERGLLVQGLLRADGGGPDTPYTAATLARNFERLAFYEEFGTTGGAVVSREKASNLHRWEEPVRLRVEFRGAIPAANQQKDRRVIEAYAARLKRVTRHPISTVSGSAAANFHVFVVDEDARRALGPDLRRLVPGIEDAVVRAVTDLPRSRYCLVLAWDPGDDGTYSRAVAVIRAEHPELMRRSCIHEEIAQGLGLSNDSSTARPSIFNDDEEFGLLTTHDEHLLRILYDRRLRPGITADEARPVVERIASELVGGPV